MRGVGTTAKFVGTTALMAIIAPMVYPAIQRAFRPVGKGLVKGALNLGESIREGAASASEQFSDLMAEVREERAEEARRAADGKSRG